MFLTDSTALSAHVSSSSPLYTNILALDSFNISCAFGSNSCISVPSGTTFSISTLSFPTALTKLSTALIVVATLIFSSEVSFFFSSFLPIIWSLIPSVIFVILVHFIVYAHTTNNTNNTITESTANNIFFITSPFKYDIF